MMLSFTLKAARAAGKRLKTFWSQARVTCLFKSSTVFARIKPERKLKPSTPSLCTSQNQNVTFSLTKGTWSCGTPGVSCTLTWPSKSTMIVWNNWISELIKKNLTFGLRASNMEQIKKGLPSLSINQVKLIRSTYGKCRTMSNMTRLTSARYMNWFGITPETFKLLHLIM